VIRDGCRAKLARHSIRQAQDCRVATNDLEDRLVRFGSTACRLSERFPRTPLAQHVAIQLARSSTSAFANYGEVQSAESRRDFIHKLGICLKELRETRTWLKFVRLQDLTRPELVEPVLSECDELLAILATSVRTARRNRANDHSSAPDLSRPTGATHAACKSGSQPLERRAEPDRRRTRKDAPDAHREDPLR